MPLLGHLPELFVVLLIGLLVFGPKRMIEMGSSIGKAVREMRDSLKDVPGLGPGGIQSLLGQDEPMQTPFVATHLSPPTPAAVSEPTASVQPSEQVATPPAADSADGASNQPAAPTEFVEGTVEHVVERPEQ